MSYVKNEIPNLSKQRLNDYYNGLLLLKRFNELKSGENEYSDLVLNFVKTQKYSDMYFMCFDWTIDKEIQLLEEYFYSKDYLKDVVQNKCTLNSYSDIVECIENFNKACRFFYSKATSMKEYDAMITWREGYYKFSDRILMRDYFNALIKLIRFSIENLPTYIVKNL